MKVDEMDSVHGMYAYRFWWGKQRKETAWTGSRLKNR
jgi:hypothetical protein